jgi:hypothetical protein
MSLEQAMTIVAQATLEAGGAPGDSTAAPLNQEQRATLLAHAIALATIQPPPPATPSASPTLAAANQAADTAAYTVVPQITFRPTYTPRPSETSTRRPTATHTATPTATDSPGLPGLTIEDVTGRLESEKSFTCKLEGSDDRVTLWVCDYQSGIDLWYHVDLYSTQAAPLYYLNAAIFQTQPSDERAIEILAYLAAMPYDGANPKKARDWVAKTLPTLANPEDEQTTTIGDLPLKLSGGPNGRFLEMGTPP